MRSIPLIVKEADEADIISKIVLNKTEHNKNTVMNENSKMYLLFRILNFINMK